MFNKLNDIKTALNSKFFEREDEIEGILISLLSRQHILLIGEPGTGKSLLASELSKIVSGSSYFQWLLTKYTTPEELFGALSLKELEKGVHVRNTSGKLPEAHFVFLDEIFKSNSAILNSLLTLINERLFYNNGTPIKSPLISLIGASNEYPEEDEGLEAMFDRLLLKYEVKPVQERKNRIKIRKREGQNIQVPSITIEELEELQLYTSMVNMSDDMHELFDDIYLELQDEGINISQRRTDQSINALKAKAFLDGRNDIKEKDMLILQHILWNNIEEKETAEEIIKKYAQDIVSNTIERIETEAYDIIYNFKKNQQEQGLNFENSTETGKKLKMLSEELIELKTNHPERELQINHVLAELKKEHDKIINNIVLPI